MFGRCGNVDAVMVRGGVGQDFISFIWIYSTSLSEMKGPDKKILLCPEVFNLSMHRSFLSSNNLT